MAVSNGKQTLISASLPEQNPVPKGTGFFCHFRKAGTYPFNSTV
jgi:hypothetical protein